MHLAKADLPAAPGACLAAFTELVAGLPTHTIRSEEQIELQQFAIPAPIAYLAALAGQIAATDLVLEPSAGTGLLRPSRTVTARALSSTRSIPHAPRFSPQPSPASPSRGTTPS
ncbi:MAG: hypothetical protein ABW128_12465 [Rhizorhabdus sp.]